METSEQIHLWREFLEPRKDKINSNLAEGKQFIVLSFSEILKYNSGLAEEILDRPTETLKIVELAIGGFEEYENRKISIRIKSVPSHAEIRIRDKRAEHLNKFLAFNGIVRRKSDIYPHTLIARFECPGCGQIISIIQTETQFREPNKCGCGRKGKFQLIKKDQIDGQMMVLEEPPDELEGNEQPRRLNFFLTKDLCSKFHDSITNPGSRVRITGTLKEIPVIQHGIKLNRCDYLVEANHVEANEESFYNLKVGKADEQRIRDFSRKDDLFEILINSIAPDISGHPEIKEALVLQLFSGVRKKKKGDTWTRGDINVLLIGDPGAGKSQLLRRIGIVAPKARLVTGKSTSGVGLTATVTKDEISKAWTLEAGALVLANKGICVIDELDKMSKDDSSAMHEALEQQTISITKANINATLKAECATLAAANPKFDRFDRNESIQNQIDMPSTLLNRFDLIFPVIDWVEENKDREIAQSIFGFSENGDDSIDTDFLRRYIAFAKKKITPKMTKEVSEVLEKFYIDMRQKSSDKHIAISARQCESLVRLTEASARARLSDKTEAQDAERAIRLLGYCLKEVGFDVETGRYDIDMIEIGSPASRTGKKKRAREIIFEEIKNKKQGFATMEEIETRCADNDIDDTIVDETIEWMKTLGELFEPRRNEYVRM